ncbi:MAG: hypothetical protein RR620_12270 [Clostridium sp.]
MNSLAIGMLLKDNEKSELASGVCSLEYPLIINNSANIYGHKTEIKGKVIISEEVIINEVIFSNDEDYIVLIESDSKIIFNNCEFIGSNNIGVFIIEGIKCNVEFNECVFRNLNICIKSSEDISCLKVKKSRFSFCNKGITGVDIYSKKESVLIEENTFFCDKDFILVKVNRYKYEKGFYKFIYNLSESNSYARVTGVYIDEYFDTRLCFIENEEELRAAILNCKNGAIICLRAKEIQASIEINKPTYLLGLNSVTLKPDLKIEFQSGIIIKSDGVKIKNIIIDGGKYYQFRDGIRLIDNLEECPEIDSVSIRRVERRGVSFWTSKIIDFNIEDCEFDDISGQCAIYTTGDIYISKCKFNNVSVVIKSQGDYKIFMRYCKFEEVNICLCHPNPSFKTIIENNNKYNAIKTYFMKLN